MILVDVLLFKYPLQIRFFRILVPEKSRILWIQTRIRNTGLHSSISRAVKMDGCGIFWKLYIGIRKPLVVRFQNCVNYFISPVFFVHSADPTKLINFFYFFFYLLANYLCALNKSVILIPIFKGPKFLWFLLIYCVRFSMNLPDILLPGFVFGSVSWNGPVRKERKRIRIQNTAINCTYLL